MGTDMPDRQAIPLIVVDVQHCFLNQFTRHLPARIATLIEREPWSTIYFTRFVNVMESPFRRLLDWHACAEPDEVALAPEVLPFAEETRIHSKPGYAGLPDSLAERLVETRVDRVAVVGIDTDMCVLKVAMDLFDLGITPVVFTDCCASTAGLQSHLAGLAVLTRNIGATNLRDAGLSGGYLAAPTDTAD